jgi:chaperone LolA
MKRSLIVAAMAICSVVLLPLADAAAGREQLEQFITSTTAWQAEFQQEVYNEQEQLVEKAAGRFSLLRPGMFRWEYTAPWDQTIVADGERVWLYDADLEQVTIRSLAGGLSQTPAALLAGDVSALNAVTVVAVTGDDGISRLEMQNVDSNSDFERVTVLFRGSNLVGLELADRLGQITRIRFFSPVVNPDLSKADFELVVPDSVDIIDESAL